MKKYNVIDQTEPENLDTASGTSINSQVFLYVTLIADCFGLVYISILLWDFNNMAFMPYFGFLVANVSCKFHCEFPSL